MVALPPQRASRHAALNQYTTVPALPSSNATLDTYEYLYDENGSVDPMLQHPRYGDLDGNYYRDLDDITAFTTAFMNEDPIAELNGDGVWASQDLQLFTNAPDTYENISLVYDWRNQLVAFVRSNGAEQAVMAEYHYDCFNRRVAAIIDTDGDGTTDKTTYFIYTGQAAWQLFAEYNGPSDTATLIKTYVYGNYIDEVLQMRDHPPSKDCFYHQDNLFSVYAMTDEAGAVVERYEYGDYGQVSIMAEDGTSRAASSYGNRYRFTGKLLDTDITLADGTQIIQYRARYLLCSSGRFIQRDPLFYFDSMNLYSYVANAPLKAVDPFGLAIVIRPDGGSRRKLDNLRRLEKALKALCPDATLGEQGRNKVPTKKITCPKPVGADSPEDEKDPCDAPPACEILHKLLDSKTTYYLYPGVFRPGEFDGNGPGGPKIRWPSQGTGGVYYPWEVLWHELIHAYHFELGIWKYKDNDADEEALTITEMNKLREWFNQCVAPSSPMNPRGPVDPKTHPLVPNDYTDTPGDDVIPGYPGIGED